MTTLADVLRLEAENGDLCALAEICADDENACPAATAKLAEILLALDRMGAFYLEDNKKKADLQSVKKFFTGVMGWTPQTVLREATLTDLADAFEGYMTLQKPKKPGLPSVQFLSAMMQRFPDGDKNA